MIRLKHSKHKIDIYGSAKRKDITYQFSNSNIGFLDSLGLKKRAVQPTFLPPQ